MTRAPGFRQVGHRAKRRASCDFHNKGADLRLPEGAIASRRVSCYCLDPMMKPPSLVLTSFVFTSFAFAALAALAAPAAHAAVCVQLDTAHDNLSEQ